MLPKNKMNIYPKSEENIDALISFYFDHLELENDNATEKLMAKTSLSLNQIGFIARKLSESWDSIFKDFFKSGTAISNLMRYGIDGLTKDESDWSFGPTSAGRPKVKEFIEFVKRTEVDIQKMERNN